MPTGRIYDTGNPGDPPPQSNADAPPPPPNAQPPRGGDGGGGPTLHHIQPRKATTARHNQARPSSWNDPDNDRSRIANQNRPSPAYKAPEHRVATWAHPTQHITEHSHAKPVAVARHAGTFPLANLMVTMRRFERFASPHELAHRSVASGSSLWSVLHDPLGAYAHLKYGTDSRDVRLRDQADKLQQLGEWQRSAAKMREPWMLKNETAERGARLRNEIAKPWKARRDPIEEGRGDTVPDEGVVGGGDGGALPAGEGGGENKWESWNVPSKKKPSNV